MLGLTWDCIDVKTGTLTVAQTLQRVRTSDDTRSLQFVPPKTDRSRRTFMLPRRTVEHLRAHRHDQNERRLALGPAWHYDWNVVCDAGDGRPIDPDSFTGAFKRLATAAGHADVRLHDMRHSAATTMLRQGVNPALVSSVQGHADVGFTLTTYSHVDAGMTSVAADALDRAFDNTGTEPT